MEKSKNGIDNTGFEQSPEESTPSPDDNSSKGEISDPNSVDFRRASTLASNELKKPENNQSFAEKGKLTEDDLENLPNDRPVWDNQIEFLMSCIATSVGLGNVWRFPFVAYENGGGAFLIPYIIVLLIVGKPMYYIECVIGQFSSRNNVKVWALAPSMKGTGYAQALASAYILSYYVAIIALCIFYFTMSFRATLPWALCDPDWEDPCLASGAGNSSLPADNDTKSSAELYFIRRVLRQTDGIEGGLGAPNWDLTVCLLIAWLIIFAVVARGVRSSGKAAYFLALFPYVVMIILLIRAVTLDGAGDGILFFLTPQWDKLIELEVWYAAVTQVFFSLSVCTGAIIMFSSYNTFRQNVYRDAMIVTTLDTFTSLMSGITIFGILGNLAKELGRESIDDVIHSGGTSLAFISYPDAIAKSPFAPQLFAVLFFLMMSVLGVGSGVALLSIINTLMLDSFPRVPITYMSAFTCTCGFLMGLVYVTPGGLYILELVDYYGGTFLVLFAGIAEIIGVFWIYGLQNICLDIEYMLKIKTSFYWRICWGAITPGIMIAMFIYALVTVEALTFGKENYVYPTLAYALGYVMLFAGIALVPTFIIITMFKNRTGNILKTIKKSFTKKATWGPRIAANRVEWLEFRRKAKEIRNARYNSFGFAPWLRNALIVLTTGYKTDD